MNEKSQAEGDLRGEFRNLGENLKRAFQTGWESEARKQLQRDLEAGLADLGEALNQAAAEVEKSEVGQKVRAGLEEVGEGLRSGELEAKVRAGLLSALQTANAEMKKVIEGWESEEHE